MFSANDVYARRDSVIACSGCLTQVNSEIS